METRSLDEAYQAALAEGGVVTAFETRFPGMTLNVTVDLSKYHETSCDALLASKAPNYVDAIYLQAVHDFPRWAREGRPLSYAPAGLNKLHDAAKDVEGAAWYGLFLYHWALVWNGTPTNGASPEMRHPWPTLSTFSSPSSRTSWS